MTAGGRDLQRALGALLALDVAQVERRAWCFMHLRHRPRQHLRSLEVVGDLDERTCGDDLNVRARPCRFRAASRRTDQPPPPYIGADRGGRTPATGAIDPSRPSSPRTVKPVSASGGIAPI